MADFFAIVRESEYRTITRLDIAQDIQQHLETVFRDGAGRLLDQELERIPLSNEAYDPDETEIWSIGDFELPAALAEAVEQPIQADVLSAGRDRTRLPDIKAIACSWEHDGRRIVAFQSIDRRQSLKADGLTILLSQNTFRRLESPGITFGDDVHAVYDDGILLFCSTWWARRVLDITPYYKEATDEDVDDFIDHPRISVEEPDAFKSLADNWVRRRLALISQMGILDNYAPSLIRERAGDYGVNVTVDDSGDEETVAMPDSKKELKDLLKFLEEDYYEGPLTDTRYVANSKKPL